MQDAKKSPVLQWASGKLGGGFENGLNKYGYSGKSLELVRFKAVGVRPSLLYWVAVS